MEGRDITWHVLPNADFKFYVTASAEVRADRRIKDKHHTAKNLSYEEVLKDIIERDNKDINRKLYPLKIVEDAIVVNTDNLTFEEVVESIIKKEFNFSNSLYSIILFNSSKQIVKRDIEIIGKFNECGIVSLTLAVFVTADAVLVHI